MDDGKISLYFEGDLFTPLRFAYILFIFTDKEQELIKVCDPYWITSFPELEKR